VTAEVHYYIDQSPMDGTSASEHVRPRLRCCVRTHSGDVPDDFDFCDSALIRYRCSTHLRQNTYRLLG